MRIPTYISYSAMALYYKDLEEYYLKHLCDNRPPKAPQEQPASVGSSFDAYVKASLYHDLFGKDDPKYEFESLFETQVEAHNRDWARENGLYVFECYKLSGAYDRLLTLLKESSEPPRFEFEVRKTLEGVPFLGKPDCRWVTKGGAHVVHDWKVNGYCAKQTKSPNKGYMLCADGYVAKKQSKSHLSSHKLHLPLDYKDITISQGYMEDYDESWADQLSLYGWGLDEKIGDTNVVISVDQIVAKPTTEKPQLRIASFRARVRESWQHHLIKRLKDMWAAINSGHIFPTMSLEDSKLYEQMLESKSSALHSDGSDNGDWFAEVVRPKYRG